MKKVAVFSVLSVGLLLAGAVGVIYWNKLAPPSIRPDALLPAETLVLAEVVDIPRSVLRFRGTELFKLWEEPEVQAFLEKPLAAHPTLKKMEAFREEFTRLWPRQVFAAIISMEGNVPKMIGGFSFAGDGKVADQWLAEPRRGMKERHPAGQAELVMHGKTEIQTYTDGEFVFAESTQANWHFFSNDVTLLRQTLDRLTTAGGATLAGEAEYQKCFAKLPADAEIRTFARTGPFVDRLMAAATAGDASKITGLESLKEIRAVGATSKIDGKQFHDAVFKLGEKELNEPLARGAMKLTTQDTAIFYSTQLSALGLEAVPEEMRGALPFIGTLEAALKLQDATLADLPKIFGPELSLIMPKPAGSVAGALALGVRDPARAAKLAAALADPSLGEEAWKAGEDNGLKTLAAPSGGESLIQLNPVLTTTDQHWLLGLSPAHLAIISKHPPGAPQLDQTPAFTQLAGQVVAPTLTFGYLNLGALLEFAYSSLRPMLALGMLGSQEAGQTIDAGKLPDGAILARHLGELVVSQGAVGGGNLWEARGNISLPQILVSGVAAFALSGAHLPPLGLLPDFGGGNVPEESSPVPGLNEASPTPPAVPAVPLPPEVPAPPAPK